LARLSATAIAKADGFGRAALTVQVASLILLGYSNPAYKRTQPAAIPQIRIRES
jgi:hypothetical protein